MSRIPSLDAAKCFSAIGLAFLSAIAASAQHPGSTVSQIDVPNVFARLDARAAETGLQNSLIPSWWDHHVTNSYRQQQVLNADIHTLLFLALKHSNQIKIAKREPLIQQTTIQEADSNFDWVRYLDSAWNDTSQPISNQLQAGGNARRFNDHTVQARGGLRKLTRKGGLLDISQQFGWQNNNSVFFIPDNQATGQLTVSYTHPLMRGRGKAYNESLVVLAKLENESARQTFLATLQDELLEVTRSYWALYLERAVLAHQMRLFLETEKIYETLDARQNVDTQRTQLITAASALESRRADLIRARTAVTNAETRLRGLINAPELSNSDMAELVPVEVPASNFLQTDLQVEIQTAIQRRPEIKAAIRQVSAGSKRLQVAQHEMLPLLNLVTQTYVNGLRGNNNFGGAFTDQFSAGPPSYSIGLQYELPVGNRLAKARVCRRKHEMARLKDEYARALQAVETEVDIAVRELNTAQMEILAKSRALQAAEAEANTIKQRWLRLVDGSGSAALNLESLLRAQERVTVAERDYVTSLLTYNLAMVSLKRANGTLLQSENVSVNHVCSGCNDIRLNKGPANDPYPNVIGEPVSFPGQVTPVPEMPTENAPAVQSEQFELPVDVPMQPAGYGSQPMANEHLVRSDYFRR